MSYEILHEETLTADRAAELRKQRTGGPLDQVEEYAAGVITRTIRREGCAETIGVAIWPDAGRGAICFGGNSIWGDVRGDKLVSDDGPVFDLQSGAEEK